MKKIATIIPSLLLTSCLFGCGNKNVDPFMITSEEKFNEAVSLKNVKYVQMARQLTIISGSIVNVVYQEAYCSPTVCNTFLRNIYGGGSSDPTEEYVEKTREGGQDKYYLYKKNDDKKWEKEGCQETDFVTPTKLGDNIKANLALGNVNYELIKDKYDKYRQAYYFETKNAQDRPYAVIMSFYNNQLNYFSYVNEDGSKVESSVTSITYGNLTPQLPEVE